tara:strand:+ start:7941 stop:8198 length:258 start_codon:yes stop_codon:yes gene_type:complete
MGNNYCIHCGCPQNYYKDKFHASRKSCRYSQDNFHTFAPRGIIIIKVFLKKVESNLSVCLKSLFNKNHKCDVNIEMNKSILTEEY